MCCIQISGIKKKQPSLHWYPLQKAIPRSHFSSGYGRENTVELRRYGKILDGAHKNLNMLIFFFPSLLAWPLEAAASEIISLYSWLEESFLSIKPPRIETHFSQSCERRSSTSGSAIWGIGCEEQLEAMCLRVHALALCE